MRPVSSAAAIEPPPALISIMSTTVRLTGRPLPSFISASSTSKTSVRFGWPSTTKQIFAVVPPMSNENTLSTSR